MWYLVLFLLSLFGPICPLSVPDTTDLDTLDKPETPSLTTHYRLNSLDHKIESLTATLSNVDESIKQLQEKAHTWAIFRHHIDSWNDQMKALEHKIDLIKRSQEENQMFSQKLTSQELILNHILSKVMYLSDTCNGGDIGNALIRLRDDGFGEIKRLLTGDRKTRNEIGARLSNILRHVQNIETENCRGFKSKAGGDKVAKLMHPISSCNGSRSGENFDLSIKALEGKINKVIGAIPQKELKQLVGNSQRNSKKLDDMLEYLEKINDRTIRLFDVEAENRAKLSTICQSMSREVTTFTGSSDLLLKKIEKLVLNVQEKVDKLAARKCATEESSGTGTSDKGLEASPSSDDKEEETEESTEEGNEREEKFSGSGEGGRNATDDVEEIDTDSGETADNQEEVNFVQPQKIGCHELTERVDGIYKFSTPELNEAGRDINERYCVFPTEGPAWTVIQNRGPYVIQENFNRSWDEYRDGFGSLDKDFWFGNEFTHQLVYIDNYELRIELEDFEEVKAWVEYTTFRIDTEKYNYNLIIGGYRGAIPDAMTYHNEHDFSTYDRRNDRSVDACCACATGYASGWWFDNCAEANLNGVFHNTPLGHNYVGIVWDQWHGDYSLKSTKMMIRPKVWPVEGEQEVLNGSSEDP